MPAVLRFGPYSVYVYAERGGRHHGAHCHVRWAEHEASVALPEIEPMHGAKLPGSVLMVLRDHVDVLNNAWIALNEQKER
ncbi:MAG TPA: DUF4160 domain-containing protein [Dehalococcoidia bacterium]|nr:DUF4160 domain-containing protein [Dehalococcoidia bacterium]